MSDRRSNFMFPQFWLWSISTILLLGVVLYEFITKSWTWGLMNDPGYITSGVVGWDQCIRLFKSHLDFGRFVPTTALYAGVFYSLFRDLPQVFYYFRYVEMGLAILLWASFCRVLTGRMTAAVIFPTVLLGYARFFDTYYYLPMQEPLGICLSGAAALLLYSSFLKNGDIQNDIDVPRLIGGVACLLLSYGCKEPFAAVGVALGAGMILFWLTDRKHTPLCIYGGVLITGTVVYMLWLKLFVASGYSSDYKVLDGNRILRHISEWLGHVGPHHGLWTALTFILTAVTIRNAERFKLVAVLIGILLYSLYFVVILPWSGGGYYIAPLGIYFAVIIACALSGVIRALNLPATLILIILMTGFNLYYGGGSVKANADYQYDSQRLYRWMAQDVLFGYETREAGFIVGSNAAEPAETIPVMVEYLHGVETGKFRHAGRISVIMSDAKMRYYLWKTDGGDQDLRRMGKNVWSPVFISDSWVMFRKMI